MNNIEIPINYNSINFYSSTSSTIIIIIIIIIIFYLLSKIIYFTNINKKYYDYKGLLFGDDKFLNNVYNKILDIVLNRKFKDIDEKILEKYRKLNILDSSYNLVNENVTLDNIELSTIHASQKQNLNNLLADYKARLEELNTIHDENKTQVSELTTIYSGKIKMYVDAVLNTLSIISYQIGISYTTPTLNKMTDSLTRLYNSMYNSLTKDENIIFIKKYYPEFNKDDSRITPLGTDTTSVDLTGTAAMNSLAKGLQAADGTM
jgi:hypothetical protein